MTNVKVSLEELELLSMAGYIPRINTPTGLEEITSVYRKNGPGFHLFFSDGSDFKAAKDHRILINNVWKEVHELQPGVVVASTDEGKKILKLKIPISPQDWIDFTVAANHHSYYYNDMVHHNSGKSFLIHLIAQHYIKTYGHKILIIVPTISLVHQMKGDFVDYGYDETQIYKILAGVQKNTDCQITISTWQSIYKQPKEWFDQFRVCIGDESHLFVANSLKNIMEKLTHCPYKFGFTGTISSESKIHANVLQGLFGSVKRLITTKDLMDKGTVADFRIKAIVLEHNEETKSLFKAQLKKLPKEKRYHAEREYIVSNTRRNLFLRNLVWSLENQNNLILFELVEKHGKLLEPLLRREGRTLHFIYGDTPGEERERIRNLVETDPNKNHNILASFATFSTGINLRALDNIIFASGSKSEIRILQSIGRVLRKQDTGDNIATLYDITDNLTGKNYTLEHFKKRIEIYTMEKFPFKIYNIPLV
jgi:superfamily II DNA or RNA helicase